MIRAREMLRARRSRLASFALLVALLGASGCCASEEATRIFRRGADDQGKSCEQICGSAIASERTNQSETFDRCEEGVDDGGNAAVVCHYVEEACTTELH